MKFWTAEYDKLKYAYDVEASQLKRDLRLLKKQAKAQAKQTKEEKELDEFRAHQLEEFHARELEEQRKDDCSDDDEYIAPGSGSGSRSVFGSWCKVALRICFFKFYTPQKKP